MLEVIYRDEYFVAINKPAGLLVHRTRMAEERKVFALQMLRDQIRQKVSPLHRLDRGTSGVLLFGLNSEASNAVCKSFEDQKVNKSYYAIVRGYTDEAGIIDHPVKSDRDLIGKEAVTHYKRIATVELPIAVGRYSTARYSLVEVSPKTGRMHQIRKHFAHIRHYIVGDKRHGDWRHNKMFLEKLECPHLLLHSYELEFYHPFFQKQVKISAPLPDYWNKLFIHLGWDSLKIKGSDSAPV